METVCKKVQMIGAAKMLCWKGWTSIPGLLVSAFLLIVCLNSVCVQADLQRIMEIIKGES